MTFWQFANYHPIVCLLGLALAVWGLSIPFQFALRMNGLKRISEISAIGKVIGVSVESDEKKA